MKILTFIFTAIVCFTAQNSFSQEEVIVKDSAYIADYNKLKSLHIKENQNELNIYLSVQYNAMPRIYENKFYCMSIDEFEKQFGHKSKKDITI